MNRSSHLDDDTLSALVDGLGAPAGPEAHLASCDECRSRLRALEAARAALRTPVGPLDDLTRRRLVTQALASAGERPVALYARPRLAALGVAAAFAAVVAGIGLAGRDGARETEPVGARLAFDLSVFAGNLGNLDDPSAIRNAVRAPVASARAPAAAPPLAGGAAGYGPGGPEEGVVTATGGASTTAPPTSTAPREPAPGPTGADRAATLVEPSRPSPAQVAALSRCLRAPTVERPPGSRLVLAATGTFADRPALVFAFRDRNGRVLAYVVARADCTLLTVQSFR